MKTHTIYLLQCYPRACAHGYWAFLGEQSEEGNQRKMETFMALKSCLSLVFNETYLLVVQRLRKIHYFSSNSNHFLFSESNLYIEHLISKTNLSNKNDSWIKTEWTGYTQFFKKASHAIKTWGKFDFIELRNSTQTEYLEIR